VLSLGLSTADQKLFEQSLITGYNLRVIVEILDLNHKQIRDVSTQLVDGQVNHSWLENVTFSATLTLLDPDELTGFDTSSPSDNALYADRMIRIIYSVYSPLLPRWVDVPLFCGPVTKVARDDAILSIEAQGKESLYLPPYMAWTSKTYPKGTRLTTMIQDLIGTRGGETHFDFPELTTALPRSSTITFDGASMQYVLDRVAPRTVRQLFYDARGTLKLRTTPTSPSFTFTEAHLLSVPKLDFDHSTIRNTVLVKGATPEGKPQITSRRYLPAGDPSSSTALARNGVKRNLVELVEDSNLTTQAAADAVAVSTLAAISVSSVGFDFDSLVIPHIEPGDVFALTTRDFSINLRLANYSIPLKAGNPQSNGTIKRVSINRTRIRR
jgi:hypothetical protein